MVTNFNLLPLSIHIKDLKTNANKIKGVFFMKNFYSVNGFLITSSDKRDELLGYLLEAGKGMENVEDNFIYSVGIDPEDDTKVYIYEVWRNKEAHENSLKMEIFVDLIKKAQPIIKGMEDYPSLIIKGGKGIDSIE